MDKDLQNALLRHPPRSARASTVSWPDAIPMTPDHVLTELRLSTRVDHDRIERVLRLMEPMSLARYTAILHGFDAFLEAWEPLVEDALPPELRAWFSGRGRARFARADVQWLRNEVGQLPVPIDASAVLALSLDALPQALGSIYVIEGSALGGRIIAPHLKSTLGLGPGRGATYFHGFGEESGAMWRDFRAIASRGIGPSAPDLMHACESARSTFAALIDVFAFLEDDNSNTRPSTGIERPAKAARD
jgi:heme oxygenase